MTSELQEELKQLEKKEARIAKQKQRLQARIKENKEEDKKLEDLFNKSGYPTPRALIKALMSKFNVRGGGRGPAAKSAGKGTRTRTKVTPELRDAVKKDLKAGATKASIREAYGISYPLVTKIQKGGFDKLK